MVKRLLEIDNSIKQGEYWQNIVKINFFKILKLTKGMTQSKEHLFKKNI